MLTYSVEIIGFVEVLRGSQVCARERECIIVRVITRCNPKFLYLLLDEKVYEK